MEWRFEDSGGVLGLIQEWDQIIVGSKVGGGNIDDSKGIGSAVL